MSEKMVDVMVHIDEDVDAGSRDGIQDSLRDLNGVMAATSHALKPHLMVVEYDPEVINSTQILGTIKSSGVHAELVGL